MYYFRMKAKEQQYRIFEVNESEIVAADPTEQILNFDDETEAKQFIRDLAAFNRQETQDPPFTPTI